LRGVDKKSSEIVRYPQEKSLDVAHLEALKKLSEGAKDPDQQAQLKWAIDGRNMKLNPVTVDTNQVSKYAYESGRTYGHKRSK
jgi:hypothetical protein